MHHLSALKSIAIMVWLSVLHIPFIAVPVLTAFAPLLLISSGVYEATHLAELIVATALPMLLLTRSVRADLADHFMAVLWPIFMGADGRPTRAAGFMTAMVLPVVV